MMQPEDATQWLTMSGRSSAGTGDASSIVEGHDRAEKERRRAEEALRQREKELSFLAQASAILGSSLDFEQTLRSVAELAIPHISDWCAVDILEEDGTPRQLAVAHADPEKVELARRLNRDYLPLSGGPTAVQQVMRTGEPMIFPEITDEMLQAAAQDEEHLRLMRELGLRSALIVPLVARGRGLGAITLVSSDSGRLLGEHDLSLALDLAQRAALAIDNSRLYQEARAAEAQVRTLNAELEQRVQERTVQLAAANGELESFAYSVSHDLRAPLRGIDGFSKVLVDRCAGSLDEQGLRYLGHIRGAAQEMGQLIDAMLRLSRLTRTEMRRELIDLSGLARSVVGSIREQEPDREVDVSVADGLVAIGDRQLVRVLLENLIGNAWKFSRCRSRAAITFGVAEPAVEGVYFVRDNGAGFDARYADKLFGPFQRLHSVSEFEGSGIGLATAQRVVHRHGGQIWAEGHIDEGATFSFTLAPHDRSRA